jgi:molybdate transport system substrate-binding protein
VTRNVRPIVAALLGAGMLAATWPGATAVAAPTPRGSVTVSAAASLTEAFTRLGEAFERKNPDATVTFNFGSSSALVGQIQGGAPADVFASADLATMDKLVSGGQVVTTPTPFARNQMQIAVKPGNPKHVKSVSDLTDIGTIALCGAAVPCGIYATSVLERADVTVPESSITRSVDAKATLGAVSQGDANAAIVYITDVKAAGTTVTAVTIPDDQNVNAVYPIAPIATASNPKLAKSFVAYVLSPAGQRTLAKYGFLAP